MLLGKRKSKTPGSGRSLSEETEATSNGQAELPADKMDKERPTEGQRRPRDEEDLDQLETISALKSQRQSRDLGQRRLIGLRWHTRLTIILVGASILFSLFFGLEFIIAKLVGSFALLSGHSDAPSTLPLSAASSHSYASTASSQSDNAPPPPHLARGWSSSAVPRSSAPSAALRSQIDWLALRGARANSTGFAAEKLQQKQPKQRQQQVSNKLGLNFALIYERDLELSPDEREFVSRATAAAAAAQEEIDQSEGGQGPPDWLVRPELKLRQLLRGYHLAMPFDPDIWTISRPGEHAHLLQGEARSCSHELHSLTGALERALGRAGSAARRRATSGQEDRAPGAGNPLERVGHQHYQLMKLLDSFGRPEAGALTGHPFWLGSYLQCKHLDELPRKRKIRLENGRPLGLRYCVGKLMLNSWPSLPASSGSSSSSFKIGLCLPKSCDSLALFNLSQTHSTTTTTTTIRGQIFQLLALNLPTQQDTLYSSKHLKLIDVFCLPLDEQRTLSPSAYLFILFLASWLSIILYCTRNKWLGSKKRLDNILALDTNIELFSAAPSGRSDPLQVVNLGALDCVKHIGCMGVILAHVLLTYLTLGTSYNNTIEYIGRDMRTMLLLSLNNVVDTFFVISGLLVCYFIFKKLDKPRPASGLDKNLAGFCKLIGPLLSYASVLFGRYIRMAPLYFLVYIFAKTISVNLGSGPLWDYATNDESLRGLCRRESWWWPVLFASDLKPITQHCVPPAWSISVDMQFFALLPVFVAILRLARDGRPKDGLLVNLIMGSLIGLSTIFALMQYKSLLDYVSLEDFAKLRLHVFTVLIRHAAHAYSQPQNRMGPILVGLVGGRLLYEYERRCKMLAGDKETSLEKLKKNTWPTWMRGKWFRVVLLLNLVFMFKKDPCLCSSESSI